MVCNDHDTIPHNNQNGPADSAGDAGTSGIPAGAAEPEYPPEHQPTLSGLEEYFPPPPLELDNSSETLTEKLDRIIGEPSRNDFNSLSWYQKRIVQDWEEENGQGVGACLNIFPSGEITGGCYSLGRRSAPGRRGKAVSHKFTRQARKMIRRAVENAKTTFTRFLTVTFDPKKAQLDESGRVDQKWAKDELIRFINTIKKKYDRMADTTDNDQWRISYIWVAEVQKNGNIHFHCLINWHLDVKWLVGIWGQSANSVNIKRLHNQEQGARGKVPA